MPPCSWAVRKPPRASHLPDFEQAPAHSVREPDGCSSPLIRPPHPHRSFRQRWAGHHRVDAASVRPPRSGCAASAGRTRGTSPAGLPGSHRPFFSQPDRSIRPVSVHPDGGRRFTRPGGGLPHSLGSSPRGDPRPETHRPRPDPPSCPLSRTCSPARSREKTHTKGRLSENPTCKDPGNLRVCTPVYSKMPARAACWLGI